MLSKVAWALIASITVGPIDRASDTPREYDLKIIDVRGFLYPGEYPLFLSDDIHNTKSTPFSISEEKWRNRYIEVLSASYMSGKLTCLRIKGKGYLTSRQPTNRWPADTMFVFVNVTSLDELKSNRECASRIGRN